MLGGSRLKLVCLKALCFEPLLLGVEHSQRLLHRLTSRLLEGARSSLSLGPISVLWLGCHSNCLLAAVFCVLARSWDIELQRLAVEHLVVIESWGCLVECNVLS